MMSIRRQLLFGLLVGLMVLFTVSGSLLYLYMRTVLTRQFDAAVAAKAHAICSLIKLQPNGDVEIELSPESMPEFGPHGHLDYFQVWRHDGSVLARSPSLGKSDIGRFVEMPEDPVVSDLPLPLGRSGRALALRILPAADEEDEADGTVSLQKVVRTGDSYVHVVVAQDRGDLDRTLALLLSALLLVAALMGTGTVVLVTIMVRQGLQPLRRVATEAAGIHAKSLNFRFSLNRLPNELQPICLRLNESLQRLEEAFQRERRFTADVAHELRTPITELRSLADVALKWPGDSESSRTYFKDAHEIAQQMESIVTTLLALARCQSGNMTVQRQPVALDNVIKEAWQRLEGQADEKNLAVTFDVPAPFVMDTDPTIALSLVGNLLSNAVQYTPHGGAVVCSANSRGTTATFTVTNDSGSLAPEDLPHLFEPFWRKDAARTDGSHCGLGLTLVAAYAEILGGTVKAVMSERHLLCIEVDLPGESAPSA